MEKSENKLYSQKEKAHQLYQLHHSNKILILPNVWDILGAKLLESINYSAIATASASIAYTNGYLDGEKIPFNYVLSILSKIANSVNVPVTADIESGYTVNETQLQENIKELLKSGIVGINIEDTNHNTKSLFSIQSQCERIKIIRTVARELDIPLFINARADVLLYDKDFSTDETQIEELINRGLAYKEAGADCFYPIVLRQKSSIEKLVKQLNMPINILTLPEIPSLKELHDIGVARVSLGPSFLKIALQGMQQLAIELKDLEGLSRITENKITNDYLKKLINN